MLLASSYQMSARMPPAAALSSPNAATLEAAPPNVGEKHALYAHKAIIKIRDGGVYESDPAAKWVEYRYVESCAGSSSGI
jgi:hypothetical protein